MTYKQLKEYIVTIYRPNFRKVHLVVLFPPLSLKGFETLQHHHFRFTRIHRYYSSSQFSESSFSSFIPPLSLKGFETLRHHRFRSTNISSNLHITSVERRKKDRELMILRMVNIYTELEFLSFVG